MGKEKLKHVFTRFAEVEAKNNSPLYASWCRQIILEEDLLDLIMHIPPGQPKPNLFFAAVRSIASEMNHPLNEVFKYAEKVDVVESYKLLKELCLEFETELIQLFKTKLVQTNEVNRASYLYPIFDEIYQREIRPLTIIEIGTSAGLLLNVDLFKYEIEEGEELNIFGNLMSPLTIRAKNFGKPLNVSGELIVQKRIGIDLNIIDLNRTEDERWLQSLIWPEQKERRKTLEKVKEIHLGCEKKLIEGNFLNIIPDYIKKRQDDTQIVIFHTHVANQFASELKESLIEMLKRLSNQTPLYHVYNNLFDGNLHVDYIDSGNTLNVKELRNIDGHGRYFYWE